MRKGYDSSIILIDVFLMHTNDAMRMLMTNVR